MFPVAARLSVFFSKLILEQRVSKLIVRIDFRIDAEINLSNEQVRGRYGKTITQSIKCRNRKGKASI